MFNDKQLHTLIKSLDCAIESMEQHLEKYKNYLSVEEKVDYKNQIEEYQDVKLNIECEIGNKEISEQMV